MVNYGRSDSLRVVEGSGGTLQEPPLPSPEFAQGLLERAAALKLLALAKATVVAYEADFKQFAKWCDDTKMVALPAEPVTVDLYLAAHSEIYRPSTLARRLVGISRMHRLNGYPSPTKSDAVRRTFQGICREQGTAPKQKPPVLTDQLRRLVTARDDGSILGLRDRALLLLTWAAGLRASEVSALTVNDILAFDENRMVVIVRRSKTDQKGENQEIPVTASRDPNYCPIRTLRAWIRAAKIAKGPLFRHIDRHKNISKSGLSRQAVTQIVKRAAEKAGLDVDLYSAHSLRAGVATAAALGGAEDRKIQKHLRHRKRETTDRYIRIAELFKSNPLPDTGL